MHKTNTVNTASSSISVDTLIERIEIRKKWEIDNPIQATLQAFLNFFRYRIPTIIDDAKWEVIWGFQRMFQGYDDRYLWSHCSENARLTLIALKWLKKNKLGYPVAVVTKRDKYDWESNSHDKIYQKRWKQSLDKMIKGFEAKLAEDDVHIEVKGKYSHSKTMKKIKDLRKKWDIGSREYAKYYGCLWE